MGRIPAFTITEILVVLAIVLTLAGLVLAASSYVHNKGARSRAEGPRRLGAGREGARSRAEAEIAAISAALENYKADNGIYPRGKSTAVPPAGTPTYFVAGTGTDDLDPKIAFDPSAKPYQDSSRYLYEQLSGDTNLDLAPEAGSKSYFSFKENQLATIKDANGKTIGLSHIKDPFGNSYGYSTSYQVDPTKGYNPTFDLWRTANYLPQGGTSPTPTPTPTPPTRRWPRLRLCRTTPRSRSTSGACRPT